MSIISSIFIILIPPYIQVFVIVIDCCLQHVSPRFLVLLRYFCIHFLGATRSILSDIALGLDTPLTCCNFFSFSFFLYDMMCSTCHQDDCMI
jgi:hypothetical protein